MRSEHPSREGNPRCERYHCALVTGGPALRAARALVDQRYDFSLGLKPVANGLDAEQPSQTLTAIALRDGKVQATLTLTSLAFGKPGELVHPYEMEDRYDVQRLDIQRHCHAEVRRVAAVSGESNAVRALYRFAIGECLARGVHSWIGTVEAGSEADPEELMRTLYHNGLTAHPLVLKPRFPCATFQRLRSSRAAFPDDERPLLPVPRRVARFATDLGARVVSVPTLHPTYPRLVVAMLADLRRVKAKEAES